MGRRDVRTIVVRKWMTVILLIVVSAAMSGMLYYLSGKAYSSGREPLRDLIFRLMQRRGDVSRNAVLASVMPSIAGMLFFMPWGFLMFLALDRPERRGRAYLFTILTGALFAIALQFWQSYLPTRVLGLPDAVANTCGAFAGAIVGHLRKRVRVQFDY